jgi:hypothetical protein
LGLGRIDQDKTPALRRTIYLENLEEENKIGCSNIIKNFISI